MLPNRLSLALLLITIAVASCSKSNPVAPAPVMFTGLRVDGNTSFTDFNQVSQLTATLMLSNNTAQDQTNAATWTSSNVAIASVSASGVVRAITSGTATITAAFQGQTGTKAASVTIACQINNTANVTFGNRGTVNQIPIWDGLSIGTLAPGQNSATIAAVAGIAHTLISRVASTGAIACAQAMPILVQCESRLFTCSF